MLDRPVTHTAIVFLFFALLFVAFFSPVLFSSRIFASDGQTASFHSSPELWTNYVWGGFPAAADPQYESWYPVSQVARLMPDGFNVFMTLAYVLASCFAYGYVFCVTGCRFSALIAGTCFGMSGFLVSHLCHTAMIHAVIWLPLILWALEKLRGGFSMLWFVIAVLASTLNILGGHLQVFVYTWLLAMAYALLLGRQAKDGWLRYLGVCLSVAFLACCLSAIQLLPTYELSTLSLRNRMTFEEFVSYSLPPKQVIQLIFPALFGTGPNSAYGINYFGEANFAEVNGYMGLLPLLLAGAAVWFCRRFNLAVFWAVAAVAALLLAVGDGTPLARLMYHVPVISYFRAPARHLMEFSLAISVLAGIGAHTILTGKASRRALRNSAIVAGLVMLISLIVVYGHYDRLQAKAARAQIQLSSIAANPTVTVQLAVFALSIASFWFWIGRPGARVRQVGVWVAVLLNLSVFTWFCDWRYAAIDRAGLETAFMPEYKRLLDLSKQRVLPLVPVHPDRFRLQKMESLVGYGPLMLKRYAELSGVNTSGRVDPVALAPQNRALDLLAVRYVFKTVSKATLEADMIEAHGMQWSRENLGIHLGRGCNASFPEHKEVLLPEPIEATKVAFVGEMSCSANVLQDQAVVDALLTADDGTTTKITLRAGRDTAEYAQDFPNVQHLMKHSRAAIFSSWPVPQKGGTTATAHSYFSSFSLPRKKYCRMDLKWLGVPGVVDIEKITFIDENTGKNRVISPGLLSFKEAVGGVGVWTNRLARPRVWLASQVFCGRPEEILQIITQSKTLPDGRVFDPARTALVEELLDLWVENPDPNQAVRVIRMTNTSVEIHSNSRTPAFMVMSDVYYPGWKATVNGVDTRIFQTDYALRGIPLPAGANVILVEFEPLSVYLGGLISLLTAIGLVALTAVHVRRKRRANTL